MNATRNILNGITLACSMEPDSRRSDMRGTPTLFPVRVSGPRLHLFENRIRKQGSYTSPLMLSKTQSMSIQKRHQLKPHNIPIPIWHRKRGR